MWLPIGAGVFGMVVAAMIGATDKPTRADLVAQTAIIPERFLRGAPFLAPLLFSNMGMLGLIMLLDPTRNKRGVPPERLSCA